MVGACIPTSYIYERENSKQKQVNNTRRNPKALPEKECKCKGREKELRHVVQSVKWVRPRKGNQRSCLSEWMLKAIYQLRPQCILIIQPIAPHPSPSPTHTHHYPILLYHMNEHNIINYYNIYNIIIFFKTLMISHGLSQHF